MTFLDSPEAASAHLDRVLGPGTEWELHPFDHGWAVTWTPRTDEEIQRDREPGTATWVLNAETGRITSHGPYPPDHVITMYCVAIDQGRNPGGAQIYPPPPPPDPGPNLDRLAPTPTDGTTRTYYLADHYQGWEKPPIGVTILISGPRGTRSIGMSFDPVTWTAEPADFLAQDRYLQILRPIDRTEADRIVTERFGLTLPSEADLIRLYQRDTPSPPDRTSQADNRD